MEIINSENIKTTIMKKLIILLTLTSLLSNLNAQVKPDQNIQKPMTDTELAQHYQQKSKNQKKTAWWLLGGGAGVFAAGVLLASSTNDFEDFGNFVAGSGAVLLGTISMVASIPVFITGAKNNGRANLLLRQSKVPISLESNRNIPVRSIGIGFAIGK
jgi:hypothetical protein